MDTMTVNISLPKGLYAQAKRRAKRYHYASVSEVIRDALRWWLNDNLTRNGFTPEFEEEVLRRAKEPADNDVEWDGVTPFTKFVLSHPPKNVKSKVQRTSAARARAGGGDRQTVAVV